MSSQNAEEKSRRKSAWYLEISTRHLATTAVTADVFMPPANNDPRWNHPWMSENYSKKVAANKRRTAYIRRLTDISRHRQDIAQWRLQEDYDTVIRNATKKGLGVAVHPEANLDPFSLSYSEQESSKIKEEQKTRFLQQFSSLNVFKSGGELARFADTSFEKRKVSDYISLPRLP